MTKNQNQKSDDQKQVAAFRKAARELGADESDDRFKDVLRTLAKHKPSTLPSKKKSKLD